MKIKLISLFVLITFFFSCGHKSSPSKYPFASKEEKETLEKFFRNILFWEGGIYTLMGSKPITTFDLIDADYSYPEFSKELSTTFTTHIYINKEKASDLKLYHSLSSEQKKHAILLSDKDYIFDTMSLWKAWEQFSKKITLSNKYLIFKTEFTPSENKDLHPSCKIAYHVTFVNVLQTACLLSKHYNLFKQVFEKDFDPLKETLNITNPNSNLWKCLHAETPQNYYQEIGLLLGYGYENTQIFKWKNNRSSNSIQKNFFDKIIGTPSSNLNEVLQSPQPFSSTNFPLPTFITFFPHNSTQLQYAQEHTHITLYYENKDFVDSTLDILAPH